jgi:hypothetical protein
MTLERLFTAVRIIEKEKKEEKRNQAKRLEIHVTILRASPKTHQEWIWRDVTPCSTFCH